MTPGQTVALSISLCAVVASVVAAPRVVAPIIVLLIQMAFLACAAFRVVLALASRMPVAVPTPLTAWPRYTVLVALHREAEIVAQLVERLAEIDYPAERLEGFLLLEAHDVETVVAAMALDRPDWLQVVIVPPGLPGTKPRALNHGLAHSSGELLTVYDAEDDPDPLQLREGAARFVAMKDARLACLQAPLRIRRPDRLRGPPSFLDRQFAVEYASLFEVTLPGMARLGMPFPLGGTSTQFRVEALRDVGGWDAWNVTEDADLGFRLWRHGWTQGVMTRPTYEPPPGDLDDWLPQRTRWMKGFMQTWGVHTRDPRGLGWTGMAALTLTLGAAVGAAAVHALSVAWVAAMVLVALAAGLIPATPAFAIGVLILGTAAAWLNGAIGARRARVPYRAVDMLIAPFYWSLLSLAFVHAAWRLVTEPFAWDKTTHRPDRDRETEPDSLVPAAAALDVDRQAA